MFERKNYKVSVSTVIDLLRMRTFAYVFKACARQDYGKTARVCSAS